MKKDCTNCHYAKWKRTSAGRRILEGMEKGACTFPAVVIPNCYMSLWEKLPERQGISKYTPGDCACWKKEEKPNG